MKNINLVFSVYSPKKYQLYDNCIFHEIQNVIFFLNCELLS